MQAFDRCKCFVTTNNSGCVIAVGHVSNVPVSASARWKRAPRTVTATEFATRKLSCDRLQALPYFSSGTQKSIQKTKKNARCALLFWTWVEKHKVGSLNSVHNAHRCTSKVIK